MTGSGAASTFVLIHGAGDSGWAWHLVRAELERRGHVVVTPDLPSDGDGTFEDYAAAVVAEVPSDRADTVVVGHSLGAFTAPLVADALVAERLVLVAPMIPRPGERPADWWEAVGLGPAVEKAAAADGGLTGHDDPLVSFLHDVEPALAAEALRRGRDQSEAPMDRPWPGQDVAGRAEVIVCTEDRFFPADLIRRLATERAGVEAVEIAASHCVPLSRPHELADLLEGPR